MKKYKASDIFERFREVYPELWRYGTQYQLSGHMQILIRIPTIGKLTYNYVGDRIEWIERWENPKEKRLQEKDMYMKDYMYFLHMLRDIMETRNLSQIDVANITGYSRVSINGYITGRTMPKRESMKEIADSLGFEF